MTIPTISLNNGSQMPVLGLGTWQSPEHEVGAAVSYALVEAGYHHVDCARVYGNEKEIGQALTEVLSTGKVRRDELFITSKLWNSDHDPSIVESACRMTLADLHLEYLDLYLMHWGIAFAGGKGNEPRDTAGNIELGHTSILDTWRAMEHLVELGLVRSIGVANFSVAQLIDLLSYAKVQPVMNQIELHPYNTQQALVEYCFARNVAVTAYSPLGNRARVTDGDSVLLEDPVVTSIAQELNKTPAQVVLRWALQRKTVVIPKSVTPTRILENSLIFDFELRDDQMSRLSNLNKNRRLVEPSANWGVPYFA